jgi:hypothetical protein
MQTKSRFMIIIVVSFFVNSLFSQENNTFQLESITLQSNSYLNYSLPRPETTLTILGWSTDGKVFYEITDYTSIRYIVLDTIEDEILFSESFSMPHLGGVSLRRFLLDTNNLQDIANNYQITPNVNKIGKLPYRIFYTYDSTGKAWVGEWDYKFFITDFNREENTWLHYLYIIKKHPPFGGKLVTRYPYSISIYEPGGTIDIYYTKSPFEERIAIIIPKFIYITSMMFGCHLSVGYTLTEEEIINEYEKYWGDK